MAKEFIIRDQKDLIFGWQYVAVINGKPEIVARPALATGFESMEEAQAIRAMLKEPHKYEIIPCGN